eukprot:5831238-Pyramimonas_sp.AAC.1
MSRAYRTSSPSASQRHLGAPLSRVASYLETPPTAALGAPAGAYIAHWARPRPGGRGRRRMKRCWRKKVEDSGVGRTFSRSGCSSRPSTSAA